MIIQLGQSRKLSIELPFALVFNSFSHCTSTFLSLLKQKASTLVASSLLPIQQEHQHNSCRSCLVFLLFSVISLSFSVPALLYDFCTGSVPVDTERLAASLSPLFSLVYTHLCSSLSPYLSTDYSQILTLTVSECVCVCACESVCLFVFFIFFFLSASQSYSQPVIFSRVQLSSVQFSESVEQVSGSSGERWRRRRQQ